MKKALPILFLSSTLAIVSLASELSDQRTIVADHKSACNEAIESRPSNWLHAFVSPIESFTSTWSGSNAWVLNRATEQFIMPDGSRAYPGWADFVSTSTDKALGGYQNVQSGDMFFTLPGQAVLRKENSATIPSFENVRIVRGLERGPQIRAVCHFEFAKPVAYCETDYPYALVPPDFSVQDCKIIGNKINE